jgi:hypothetical protein
MFADLRLPWVIQGQLQGFAFVEWNLHLTSEAQGTLDMFSQEVDLSLGTEFGGH